MARSNRSVSLLALALASTSGACTDVLVVSDPTFVAVTEIEVTNTTDAGTLLDVEVHLYAWPSGLFLGCSGELDGMEYVDESNVVYYPTAFFGRAQDGATLSVDELRGRDLFAVVIEDDHEPCPVPTNEGHFDLIVDDLIGTSPVFRGEELDRGIGFGFDNVVWLALEGLR